MTGFFEGTEIVLSVIWRMFSLWCMYCMFQAARKRILIDVIAFGLACIFAVLWSM